MLMMNVVIFSSNGNQEFITTSSSHPLSFAVEKYGFDDGQNHKLITFCGQELLQTPIRESHIVQKKGNQLTSANTVNQFSKKMAGVLIEKNPWVSQLFLLHWLSI